MYLKDFYKPLRESSLTPAPLLSKDELNTIFSNLETIINLNEVLCGEISERLQNWNDRQKLGDVFVRWVFHFVFLSFSFWLISSLYFYMQAPLLRMYQPYCNNYSFALQALTKCCERSEFDQFVKV